jgi:hypothetical protein
MTDAAEVDPAATAVRPAVVSRKPKPAKPIGLWSLIRGDYQLVIWTLFILLFPIYAFKSGVPQPADMLVLTLAPGLLRGWNGRLGTAERRAVAALFVFTGYTILSAFAWSIGLATVAVNLRDGFLLSPVFYIYNALVFLMALLMHRKFGDRFVAVTVRAVVLSVLVQVPMSFFFGHHSVLRSTGMFNNPNQFGYYAVLSAAIIIVGRHRAKLPTFLVVVGMVASGYLALASASKAALAAYALLFAVSSLTRPRTALVAALIAAAALAIMPSSDVVDVTLTRLSSEKKLDFTEERGYDRIGEHKEDWVFGAGEGGYVRYVDTGKIGDHELHSSGGTVFFCYGIAGTLLFLAFFFQLVRGSEPRQIMLLGAVLAYGLSHQGLRLTLFWVLLSVFLFCGTRRKDRARRGSSRPAPRA